ncbi:MAG: GH32 C-terminal domain-containing protein [Bacteroidales bacterium]|nr:GH32 C-terminal domain-containing protein [Bacteroidales bacterium]MBN2666710.1 GH32 C-terminal domain-containing protein [Bacteroidales bacterium]
MLLLGLVLVMFMSSLDGYGQVASPRSSEEYYPEYHYYPSFDPTGLFYYGGQYFLNWGAATSKDFVRWRMTPYGLERSKMFGRLRSAGSAPPSQSRPQVLSGMSGTVVVDWNNSSGLGKNGNPPLIALQMDWQRQSLVYSNDTARTWIRHETPVVIPNSTGIYRDPKVFWYEPDKKWIMVMGWSEIQEVKFFSSKNLLDWEYMSKFGPWGAVAGQWECVDFFPLAVDGDVSRIKWVLAISLQPRNGEYFIGEFDGTRFSLDKDFIRKLSYDKHMPSGQMLFDFERSLDEWKVEGDAFIDCPTVEEESNGKEGYRSIKSSGTGKGKITSPEFRITRNYINFLIGGGYYPGEECVNLVIDGKVVRTQTGNNSNAHLSWTGWEVTEFRGKDARIEIVDNIDGRGMLARGYIFCDAFMLSDDLPRTPYIDYNPGWEKAFWADWGPDFYAVRSWNNYAPDEKRTIWVGWMGIWTYAFTEPGPGHFSVPRNLELRTFDDGIRLVQNPVKELEALRTVHKVAEENSFEGIWQPKKFLPSKNAYELIVEFENISAVEFGLNLCVGENQKTVVGYDASREELYVDRRYSGKVEFSSQFPVISKGPLRDRTKIIKLHIFIDKCSVEVFGNDGETTISSKIYPGSESTGISLFSNSGRVKVRSLEFWELAPVNLY